MNDNDIKIICADCKTEFAFTERDQKFYAEKGYVQPKRCKQCRIKKKRERENNQY